MNISNINYLAGKDITEFYITVESNEEYIHARIKVNGDMTRTSNKELARIAKIYISRVIDPTEYLHDMSNQQYELKNLIDQSKEQIRSMSNIVNQFISFSDLSEEQMEKLLENYPVLKVGDTADKDMVYNINGILYRAIQTVKIVDDSWLGDASLFVKFIPTSDGEGQEIIGEWVQPQGAHDAYHIGDKVIFNGKVYISVIDDNIWSPIDHPRGWEDDIIDD